MKTGQNFSFSYGRKPFGSFPFILEQEHTENNTTVRRFTGECGLAVTSTVTEYPALQGRYTVRQFENTGDTDTREISRLYDADFLVKFDEPYPVPAPGFLPAKPVYIRSYAGSNCDEYEYGPTDRAIRPGESQEYSCTGGRSCQSLAPYFEVCCGNSGALIAIGWTGQWKCRFECTGEGVWVRFGVEDADFYLRPGEKVQTASCVTVEYSDGSVRGHNRLRRLLKERCILGKGQHPPYGSVGAMTWGAMTTDVMLDHIRGLKEYETGVECFFVDAGWYGHSTQFSKNEHMGDWFEHTGSWNINPTHHPDAMEEVSRQTHEAGMELLLWVEPERARAGSDWAVQYPERMIDIGPEGKGNLLVNLAQEETWQMVYDMLCGHIEKLQLQCYRQDFNFDPLPYWRHADEEGRRGLTEIKYINGMYRLWDALLERFPGLYIDNCASGGRRNDFEMLCRSIPLWRSDYQCWFNADPDVGQAHNTGISMLTPYSGTGVNGDMEDVYELRSNYASALSFHSWWWTQDTAVEPGKKLESAKRLIAEYKRLRPYFSCDFYPLTPYSLDKSAWCVWQYHRPEEGDGTVMAFRRSESEMGTAVFALQGLDEGTYEVENLDSGEVFRAEAGQLGGDGLTIRLPEKRSSTVFLYRKI